MEKNLSKTIQGLEVKVNEFSVKKALTWLHRLQRVFGPTLASFLAKENDVNANSFQIAFNSMNAQMSEAQYYEWVLELTEGVVVEGTPVTKDNLGLIFKGKLMFLHKVLWFVLEVNFSDFLEELKSRKEVQESQAFRAG